MADTENLELEELGDAKAEQKKKATGGSADGAAEAPAGDAPALAEGAQSDVRSASDLEAVYDVPVQVSAVLGKTHMRVSQLLKLGRGAVVVVEDRLGVTMTEIVKQDRS